MKNTLLFILLLACIGFSACEKEKTPPTELEKLPAATQEGKNTFGCLVDGKAWTPKWGGLLKPGITPYYNNVLGNFSIITYFYKNGKFESGFSIGQKFAPFFEPGTYFMDIGQSNYFLISKTCVDSVISDSRIYHNINGVFQITRLDVSTGIISGTFEFDAVSETCQDTVRITEGRFDIKYK